MGVLIVAGTVALVVLLVQRAGRGGGSSLPPMSLELPAGSRIVGIAGAEGRFAVLVQRPDGDRIVFLDARTGRPVGEVIPGAGVPVR
ncbi:DUF6476 family protein [Roseococcus pinisoli]|nr:DUF6476 family protein [Roseococcus pinisoli]